MKSLSRQTCRKNTLSGEPEVIQQQEEMSREPAKDGRKLKPQATKPTAREQQTTINNRQVTAAAFALGLNDRSSSREKSLWRQWRPNP
ncbi:hypothetical protein LRS05_00195 [Flavobacterium sp. J372]|uniref:hypothetical protein n=1 Tax=Flavobacterium sp. J372 TaxID=2898436 RepID=UPI002151D470|nr:hypothetical protein [Flavobacterium sp. J372]MCR5860674.1 hypothetical protein [Flavobacterium sp. J372]